MVKFHEEFQSDPTSLFGANRLGKAANVCKSKEHLQEFEFDTFQHFYFVFPLL